MCIVGYFSKCECGHFSHPDHVPVRNGNIITGFGCSKCDIDHTYPTELGGSLERPPTVPDYVQKYLDDPVWMERFLPELIQ